MFYISSFTAEHSQEAAGSVSEETWYVIRSKVIYGKGQREKGKDQT